jgi:nicotinamide riboside kinase
MPEIRFIAVLGAESTGKTTLCAQLARACQGLWVPEYLRDFCVVQGRTPRADEQRHILQMQIAREQAAGVAARERGMHFVFCDTTPLMTAIYSELLFKDAALVGEAMTHQQQAYALTLFLQPDIGWQADGQRDGAQVQPVVTAMIEQHLKPSAAPYVRISGSGDVRLASALLELRRIRT